MEENPMFSWALKYLRHYSIIPIGPDKRPLIEWKKYQYEKADEKQVREWFDKENPPNIGIVTGKISNITVVDVEKGGKWEHYPVTQTSRTGGGGYHLYYKYAEGMGNKARIHELTDIRGDGGYVVAPPSLHASGNRYEWTRKEVTQPFPYSMFNASPEKKGDWETLLKGAGEGERNQTAAQIIGKFISALPPEDWMTTAWQMAVLWNQGNTPPLPERELRATFNSIMGREVRKRKEAPQKPVLEQPGGVLDDDVDIRLMSEIAKDITDDMTVSYPTGFKVIDDNFMGGLKEGDLMFITGYSGLGKCHGKGTRILMHDGSVKNVEDVAVGDRLMGDDSKPRNVLSLARGRERMYEISTKKSEPYTVNESHILSLRSGGNNPYFRRNQVVDIPLKDYMATKPGKKAIYKWYKVPVDFPERPLPIDPYFIGVWLGDGTADNVHVTSMDKEVVDCLYQTAEDWGITVTIAKCNRGSKADTYCLVRKRGKPNDARCMTGFTLRENPLLEEMKRMGLIGNKHIPHDYRINSRENRLQLLAGLIDTDGYTKENCIEWTSNNKGMAEDFVYLCRSLGFHAQLKSKKVKGYEHNSYYRVVVAGNLCDIPLRVERRKGKARRQVKNHLNYGITVTDIGIGDYYGFEIDGNHRYLLDDFTVTHNTSMMQSITYNLDKAGHPTMWFTFEVPVGEMWRKFKDMGVSDRFSAYAPEKIATTNMAWVEKKIIEARDRFKTKIVFIDHLGFLAMEPSNYDKAMAANLSSILTIICRRLKTLAIREGVAIVLAGHVRKPDTKKGDSAPTQHDIKDSSGVVQESDGVFIIHRKRKAGFSDDEDVYEPGTMVIIDKNRRTGITRTFKANMLKGRLMDDDEFMRASIGI